MGGKEGGLGGLGMVGRDGALVRQTLVAACLHIVAMIRAARGCVSLGPCIWWVGEKHLGGARTVLSAIRRCRVSKFC